MTHPSIESVLKELDVLFTQADQYQINAGYPVETPAKEIGRVALTQLIADVKREEKEAIRKKVQSLVMLDGQSAEEVKQEIINWCL